MRYARTDIQNYTPPGGVCAGHTEPADAEHDQHFSVDCPVCEPLLAHDPLWAGHPDAVPLTEIEQQRADRLERDAQQAQAEFAMAMAKAGLSEASKELAAAKRAARTPPASTPTAPEPAVQKELAASSPAPAVQKRKRVPKQQSPAQA
jgi:hypothetical protein